MKKRRIQGLGLLVACLLLMAGPALAAMRNTVFLQETGNGAVVSVRLEERQDDILSLGLSLQISFTDGDSSQAGVSFAFDSAIRSKIMEYRYNEDKGVLSLYISGQENLFTGQELTLGTVAVNIAEGSTVTARISVIEDSLQVINAAYDNENNERVSAPEAPEFTVGGEAPGGEEIVPPPETSGQNPGGNEPNSENNGQNPGDNGQNPGSSGQNSGYSGQNPGSNGQDPGYSENPADGESQESAIRAEKPTGETAGATDVSKPAENETAQNTIGTEIPENTQDGEEPSMQASASAAGENQVWYADSADEDGIWRVLLFVGLGIAGIAALLLIAIWADRRQRARRRRQHRRELQHSQGNPVRRSDGGERMPSKTPAARETAKHRHRVSGPEAAERRAAAREAARIHMEQHKREGTDAQSGRQKADE